jgi:hypothetical protein
LKGLQIQTEQKPLNYEKEEQGFLVKSQKNRDLLSQNNSQLDSDNKMSSNKMIKDKKKPNLKNQIQTLPITSYGFHKIKISASESLFNNTLNKLEKPIQSSTKIKTQEIQNFEINNNISFSQYIKKKKSEKKLPNDNQINKFLKYTYDENHLETRKGMTKNKFQTQSAQNFSINTKLSDKNFSRNISNKQINTTLDKNNFLKIKLTPRGRKNLKRKKKVKNRKLDISVSFEIKPVNKSMQYTRKINKSNKKQREKTYNKISKKTVSLKKTKKLKPLTRIIKSKKSGRNQKLIPSRNKKKKIKSSKMNKTMNKSRKKKIKPKSKTPSRILEMGKPAKHKKIKSKREKDNHFNKLTKLYKNRKSKIQNKIKILQNVSRDGLDKSIKKKKRTKNKAQHKIYKKTDTLKKKTKLFNDKRSKSYKKTSSVYTNKSRKIKSKKYPVLKYF